MATGSKRWPVRWFAPPITSAAPHIEGGEVSGTIDELFRHCNTKLAYCHFVSSQAAARRVMALGESRAAIHVIGSPELDFHSRDSGVSITDVKTRYEIPFDAFGIAIFHPVTSESDTMGAQAKAFFRCVRDKWTEFCVILPNNDPGSEDILAVIRRLPPERFRTIPLDAVFAFLRGYETRRPASPETPAPGVREAPFLGIPLARYRHTAKEPRQRGLDHLLHGG